MKNMILKGLAGIVAAVMIALAYHPISAQAAGEPQVSLTSAYYVNETTKFVLLNNNGSLGDQVNNYYWNIYEKAVDNDFGTVCLEYSESRKGISGSDKGEAEYMTYCCFQGQMHSSCRCRN